jgi:hypothetical protein
VTTVSVYSIFSLVCVILMFAIGYWCFVLFRIWVGILVFVYWFLDFAFGVGWLAFSLASLSLSRLCLAWLSLSALSLGCLSFSASLFLCLSLSFCVCVRAFVFYDVFHVVFCLYMGLLVVWMMRMVIQMGRSSRNFNDMGSFFNGLNAV